ncbi:MAG: hypothetical protein IPL53_05675 [Ignavibacteria bacterium]|nr:hypothetical protein [Ignavibacteria bacterium]
MDKETVQKEFDRLTSRGIILGCVWILGAGSVISLISSYQANKLFKKSGFALEGKNKIRQCLYIGIAGLLVWVIAIAIIILFKKQ